MAIFSPPENNDPNAFGGAEAEWIQINTNF